MAILRISDLFCPMTDSWESYMTLHRVSSLPWLPVILELLRLIRAPEPKVHWWAYSIGGSPSFVVHTLLNSFSSETAWPIKVKFHMAPPWDGGTKLCSNGPGHITKMATMSIDGKNLKKSSSEPKCRWPWKLVCSIGCLSTTKFVQMMTLDWPWPVLRQGQIWSLILLYG